MTDEEEELFVCIVYTRVDGEYIVGIFDRQAEELRSDWICLDKPVIMKMASGQVIFTPFQLSEGKLHVNLDGHIGIAKLKKEFADYYLGYWDHMENSPKV